MVVCGRNEEAWKALRSLFGNVLWANYEFGTSSRSKPVEFSASRQARKFLSEPLGLKNVGLTTVDDVFSD